MDPKDKIPNFELLPIGKMDKRTNRWLWPEETHSWGNQMWKVSLVHDDHPNIENTHWKTEELKLVKNLKRCTSSFKWCIRAWIVDIKTKKPINMMTTALGGHRYDEISAIWSELFHSLLLKKFSIFKLRNNDQNLNFILQSSFSKSRKNKQKSLKKK